MYHGDIAEDATIRFAFNTNDADGAPITLAGTPALSVYKDGSDTQTTAGVTLTVDFDGLTGYHLVTIDTSADAFYAAASDYRVVITTGTVDGTSVVGSIVGSFSIQKRVVASVTGAVGSVTGNVGGSVNSVTNKTGYALGATGLDLITCTDPAGLATTFPQMVVQVWRRFFKKSTLTATQLKTYNDDGTTVSTTQTVSDDGTTQTQGAAS